MRTVVLVITMAGLAALPAHADFDARLWRYSKDLSGPGERGFFALQVDSEVYAHAQATLADLRLVEAKSAERPYELRTEQGEQRREPVAARRYNLSRVPGVGTRFELDLGTRGKATTEITIDSPDRNFRYQVTVEGSYDARQWAVLRTDGAIFDFSGDVTARSTSVRLPETTFRYLRVMVADGAGSPFKVEGAHVERLIARPAERVQVRPAVTRIAEDPGRRATDVTLDLGSSGQPCDQVTIRFTDDNCSRQVEVAGSDEGKTWNPLGAGVVFRYHTATFVGEQQTVPFAESRFRFVRASVMNGDNAPLKVTSAGLYGLPRTVIFEWDPARPVKLYYGALKARAPQYDLAAFLRYQQVQPKTGLALGPEQRNPSYGPPKPKKPWTEERPWLLWLVIGLAVVGVGWMILRMMLTVGTGADSDDSG